MIVIDIGGTKIAVARWVDGRLSERVQIPMPATEPEWRTAIRSLALKYPGAGRLGVAVTGSTDGRIVKAINRSVISFWDGYPLAAFLEETWRCPAFLLNDAQAAAWGEYVAHAKQGESLLFITLSTGVGGGLVLDGKLHVGHLGLAGHVGHVSTAMKPLDGDVTCGCGRLNCLETIASGAALARQASRLSGTATDAASVFAGYHAGDEIACRLIANAALAVAHQIADSHATLGIDRVCIGGSVGLARGMIDAVLLAQRTLPPLFRVPVQAAILREDAGLIGVGHWVMDGGQLPRPSNALKNQLGL